MEIAGIALAIFPLVVKGLYSLLDASRTVKNLRDYHWVLGRLVRQFNMEKSKFGNTCGEILGELVTRELLIGKGWDDPNFQKILEARFRPHTAKLFIDLICFLRSNLQELIDKLELDKIQKVSVSYWFLLISRSYPRLL